MKKYTDPHMIIQLFGHESVMTGSAGNVDAYFEKSNIDSNKVSHVYWDQLQETDEIISFN